MVGKIGKQKKEKKWDFSELKLKIRTTGSEEAGEEDRIKKKK